MVALKRGRKMFSSIFPKFGSSFFDLNMSLGKLKACSLGLDLSGGPVTFSAEQAPRTVSVVPTPHLPVPIEPEATPRVKWRDSG